DGEIRLNSGQLFSLEIDTGSERYEKLVAKFVNYRRYLDYCIEHNQQQAWVGMLFVCKDSKLPIQKDIRVQTIIRAAIEGLQHYCWTFILQIYRSQNIVLTRLLEENETFFKALDIAIPPKINPLKIEKQRKNNRESVKKKKVNVDENQLN